MAPKRHSRRRPRSRTHHKKFQPQKRRLTQTIENTVLALLFHAESSVTLLDLAKATSGGRSLAAEPKAVINHLLHSKWIRKTDKRYALAPSTPLYIGTLEQNARGFGFVSITGKHGRAPEITKDLFISKSHMGAAYHGDSVLVKILGPASDNKPEGVVIDVIKRGPDTIAGIIKLSRRGVFVKPEDNRYPFTIQIDPDRLPHLEDGNAVIARIKSPEKTAQIVSGEIIEVLGSPDNIDVQMRLVIEKFRLVHMFSDRALKEAESIDDEITAGDDRVDLRSILHVTIDGETAKDFDDAISVVKIPSGYRLYVSIADVSHFVRPGSALDKDAYERGTSIYFPGRVIPMLPEKLSNNLCSLIPEVDRLTLTAIMDFDEKGNRKSSRFCRSVITSHRRFTYTTVREILVDRNQQARSEHQQFLEMLEDAAALAKTLQEQRKERGSIGFTLPEPEIHLEPDGRIASITRAERNFAHQIIEEFMLAANEAVAQTFTKNNRPSLYRIHELPDKEKVMRFAEFAKTLDLHLPTPEISPQWFCKVLELAGGSPKEYVVNNLLLRAMQQARYSPDNVGHFALAAENYTHFTSPIRRYPDLMVHRELCRMISQKSKKSAAGKPAKDLGEKGEFLSDRERGATNAERNMADRLKCIYIEKHLGESFTAIISGVSEYAFYIELLDLFISGTVPLEHLTDEYFIFDGRHHRVVGEVSGITYQIGNIIEVEAIEIDKNKNRIIFTPCSTQ